MPGSERIKKAIQYMCFANVFLLVSVFRERGYGDLSLDFQIIIKLGFWLAAFVVSLCLIRYWFEKLWRVDNVFFTLLLLMLGASCIYAPHPIYAAGAFFSVLAVFALSFLSAEVLTRDEWLSTILSACAVVTVISFIFYVVFPETGRMHEWVNGEEVPGTRLSGITGTANAIGYMAAFACVCLHDRWRVYWHNHRAWLMIFAFLFIAAMVMSESRASFISLIAAIVARECFRLNYTKIMIAFAGVAIMAAMWAFLGPQNIMEYMSRSGEMAEITTMTGRTNIWKAAVPLITERPIFGWGYSSVVHILPDYVGIIGFTPAHLHNLFLQILFSGGLVAFVLFILAVGVKGIYALLARDELKVALFVFLLVDGLVEPSAFQGTANLATLVLAMIVAMPYQVRR